MTMMRRLQTDLKRWLAAEAVGDERRAEDAFGTLLASAPRLRPSAGFAERVLWAIQPAPAPHLALGAWWWKAAIVTAVTLVGVATGLAAGLAVFVIPFVGGLTIPILAGLGIGVGVRHGAKDSKRLPAP
jgi:hypothetical protein